MSKIRFVIIALLCVSLVTCKKENSRPQWDIGVLGPLAKGTLGINNIITDSLIHVNPDSTVTLIYNKNLYSLSLDSLFNIPDTTVVTPFVFPFSGTLPANFSFPFPSSETRLAVNNVQLRYAIIKSGKAHIVATNKLHTKIFFNYSIPKATLNGVPFTVSAFVDSADVNGAKTLIKDVDLSGYDIDLTGIAGNQVNTIEYQVTAYTDPNGPAVAVAANDTFDLISDEFVGIIPYYAKGYLGQTTLNVGPDSTALDLFKSIKSGTLNLQAATMKLTIENDIGMDAQLKVSSIQSVNSNTGTTIPLVASSIINQTININRAGAAGSMASPSYIPVFYTLQVDNSNSNFTSLLNNLPDHLLYSLSLQTNPLGNVSGDNDFAFADHLITAKLDVEIPLNFSSDHLTFVDTTDFVLGSDSIINNLGAGTLTFTVNNGYPFAMNLSLVMIDGQNRYLDMLLSSAPVAAAPLDANFKVTGKTQSQFVIPIDEASMDKLHNASRMVVTAAFTTAAGAQQVKIYSTYSLDYKLIGDFTYHVR